ncbi:MULTISPECIES: MFS transporter [Actinoalloteichus]|uniref:Drug resistance transporter, EmrB/QacA subfamily n=1 Tax=Actinoalloteichus fjordicus TaxID=1612552 RepID=A0AAC9PPY4_9PSEU|nr:MULTISPECIES: MFS transporter [Actinoalloteichus]APU12529.1 drug resistance transporter, EmrB/QacA subfamily [Actinoalloteichus fjordicus]APU18483.1 drug resistance transporter, EmrB/QacA subfamily [Actinoalloteichus sp. GBA129-24]
MAAGAAARPGQVRLGTATGRLLLLATVLGSAIAGIDATVVNVALPVLGRDLDADFADLQWTVNGYTLTLASLILLGGSLGDRYGRRRVFVVGIVWFAVASALCAVAVGVEMLVASRVLQGIGGALLTPGSLALISASFHPEDRAKAIGAWSGFGGIATAIGPFLGGWLVEGPGWRWIFLINLPLAAAVVALVLRAVPESRDPAAAPRLDVLGGLLGVLGLGGATFALIAAGGGWSATVGVGAVIGIAALAGFVTTERRRRYPMLPPDIFANRQFTSANLVTATVYAALGGVFFLLVVQLQVAAGFSPILAGTALLPVTLIMLALSARVGGLADRLGPRLFLSGGPLLAAGGVLLMLRIGPGSSYPRDVLPAVIVFGLGLALIVAPLTATVLTAAETRHAGVASGVNNAIARASGLLAVAVLPMAAGISGDDYQDATAFTHGFHIAMVLCAALLVFGGLIGALLISDRPDRPGTARPRGHYCAIDGPPVQAGRRVR